MSNLPSPPASPRVPPPARTRRRTVAFVAAMCVLVPTASLALGFGGAAVFRHLLNRYHPLVLLDDGANNGAPASWRPHVVKVIDGDTIEVDTGKGKGKERVRLLGIDTPETKDPRKPVQCFGREASARTAELLPPGTPVRLEADVERRDRYDRVLAYVYRWSDDLFVNLELARAGYADALTIPPNVAHTAELTAAVAEARREQRGLWQACTGFGVPA